MINEKGKSDIVLMEKNKYICRRVDKSEIGFNNILKKLEVEFMPHMQFEQSLCNFFSVRNIIFN
jgi:hypothetical protein